MPPPAGSRFRAWRRRREDPPHRARACHRQGQRPDEEATRAASRLAPTHGQSYRSPGTVPSATPPSKPHHLLATPQIDRIPRYPRTGPVEQRRAHDHALQCARRVRVTEGRHLSPDTEGAVASSVLGPPGVVHPVLGPSALGALGALGARRTPGPLGVRQALLVPISRPCRQCEVEVYQRPPPGRSPGSERPAGPLRENGRHGHHRRRRYHVRSL